MEPRKLTGLLLSCSVLTVLAVFNKQFAGPFNIVVKQVADCDHPEKYPLKIVGNKIRRFNRTSYLYSAVVILPIEVNDDLKLRANVAVFGNGGWRDNYFVWDLGGICYMFRNYGPQIWQVVSSKINSDCPVPIGNYSIDDLSLDVAIKWPALPYNKYRADFSAAKKGKTWFCKRFFVDIVPKSNKN